MKPDFAIPILLAFMAVSGGLAAVVMLPAFPKASVKHHRLVFLGGCIGTVVFGLWAAVLGWSVPKEALRSERAPQVQAETNSPVTAADSPSNSAPAEASATVPAVADQHRATSPQEPTLIKQGTAWIDQHTGTKIGVATIHVQDSAKLLLTFPGEPTRTIDYVEPGRTFSGKGIVVTVMKVDFVRSEVQVAIDKR